MSAAFAYDITRCICQKPFALMESTPSQVNWQSVCKLKKPGMHLLSSMQAIAHGADTVQYFQWRKSRGSSEKFHGAVVDHAGHENTRTFRDVAQVGSILPKLNRILGAPTPARAALIFDWDNRWALNDSCGPRHDMQYMPTVMEHYRALIRQGIDVDVVDESADLSSYRLVVAPMLYMIKPGFAERAETFVQNGGILVATCRTGCVDQDDLCFLGGFPGPLRRVLGIWAEETDALYDDETNGIVMADGSTYSCSTLCDLIHAEGAKVEGVYAKDFYKDTPVVTVNDFGKGHAWYVASRADEAFLDDFYTRRVDDAGILRLIQDLPKGVQAASRASQDGRVVFIMNFSNESVSVKVPSGTDLISGESFAGAAEMPVNGVIALLCKEDAK